MKGKNVVVTGGNAGIGFETAKALLNKGANVIIVSRSEDKARNAVSRLKQLTSSENVSYVLCQLGKLESIREAAAQINAKFSVLDVLVNNAGTWLSERKLTEQGVEMQMAVNHIGYFYMTYLLLGALGRAESARVVCVGSDSHLRDRIYWEDLTLENNYHGLRSYAQSKSMNVMFSYYFADNVPDGFKITNNCLQPGLVKTDIGLKKTNWLHSTAWRVRRTLWFWRSKTPAQGADTSVYLASSPEVEGETGKYWDLRKAKPSNPETYDKEKQEKLWKMSCDICGIDDYWAPLKK